jgi:methyl-accepting chemotaxis protein
MRWTIRRKLFGLTICGLAFVAAVSATGYWGISSVAKTTVEVASTSSAIRNHIEAGVYNDLARADVSAVFTAKGDEQQNKVDDFDQHNKLLQDRISKARSFAFDPASRAMLDDEQQVLEQYMKAGAGLVKAIVHEPSAAPGQLGPYLQLYKDLQGKIEITSDQLEKGAKEAEVKAAANAAKATRATFIICGSSLLLLLVIATRVTLGITRPLDAFSTQFEAMTAANDLTSRVDDLAEDEIGRLGKCLNHFVQKVHDILAPIAQTAKGVATASENLSTTSQQITENSEKTTEQAQVVSEAGGQVSTNLQTLASGADEMNSTIAEIARNATEAARVAGEAVEAAEAANQTVSRLGDSSVEIEKVIEVITSIAQQTNLLALNATIEAARAGEAGKGFAVVANEVKELAKQTAKATEEIKAKIGVIRENTGGAVGAIAGIKAVIDKVSHISTVIATAVEQQSATTSEMSRNVSEAARGASTISDNIKGVADAAQNTSTTVGEAQTATADLARMATQLRDLVGRFKVSAASAAQEYEELPLKAATQAAGAG